MAAILSRANLKRLGLLCFSPSSCTKTESIWGHKLYTHLGFYGRRMNHDGSSYGNLTSQVENTWRRKISNTALYGDAIFVLGPMGGGKTTIINDEFKSHSLYKRYAFVDTDEMMANIPGFDLSKVREYYPLARKIAINLTDWIMEERLSFIAEGTCVKYEELIAYMERLKDNGYSIKVRRIPHYSLEEVLRRARLRVRRLPDEVVTEIYEGSRIGLDKLFLHNKNGLLFEEIKHNGKVEGEKDEACLRELKNSIFNQNGVRR